MTEVNWSFRTERWDAYKLGIINAKKQVPFDYWKYEHEGIQQAYSDGYKFGLKSDDIRRSK